MSTFGLTLLYVAFGLLLVWSVERPRSSSPTAVGLAWIGRHSYSIYLWHMPLWAMLFPGKITFLFFAEGVVVSILFGAALSTAVERPSLAVRDRLFPAIASSRRPLQMAANGPHLPVAAFLERQPTKG